MKRNDYYLNIPELNDKKLKIYLWEPKKSTENLFIHFHGLPGGPLDELTHVPQILGEIGYKTITFNYPGLWDSPGVFSYDDVLSTLKSLYHFVYEKLNPNTVYLFGESFGGAISVNTIAHDLIPIKKVVLRSPLLDITPLLPFFPGTISYLRAANILRRNSSELKEDEIKQLNPINWLDKTSHVPFWGVIGANDEILPARVMKKAVEKYSHIDLEIWDNFPHNFFDNNLWNRFKDKLLIFLSEGK
ncbi:MAG: alpha/beta hydrolase [Candidatus Hodarchaeales archaeon]